MMTFHDAVRRATKAVGGQKQLAEKVCCAQSEISRLCTTAQSIPPETAARIVDATRGTSDEVSIIDLLPASVIDAVRDELARSECPHNGDAA